MDSQIQEQKQHPQQIFHCKKDKQPSLYLCLDLCCKQPRFACSKCQDLHVSHSNYLFPIEEVTKQDFRESKIADYFDDAHILIKSQSEGMRTAHRLLNKLNSAKEQLLQSIQQIKCELLETMDIRECELNTNRIADAFITPRQDSQEYVEYLLYKVDETRKKLSKGVVQLRQSDTKRFFERQMKKVVFEYENTVKQMSEILGERCTLVDKEKKDKDENEHNKLLDIQNQSRLKAFLSTHNQSSSSFLAQKPLGSGSVSDEVDKIIEGDLINKQIMHPLLSLNLEFSSAAKLIKKQQQYFIEFRAIKGSNNSPIEVTITIKGSFSGKIIEQYSILVGKVLKEQAEFMGCIFGMYLGVKLGISNIVLVSKSTSAINLLSDTSIDEEFEDYQILANKLKGLFEKFENKLISQNTNNQKQSSNKLASMAAQTNSSSSITTSDSIILKNSLFKQLMDPFLKTKPDFTDIFKRINPNIPYLIEFEGSSKERRGLSGSGFALKEKFSGKIIKECAIPVGNMICNQAEYLAAIYGLYTSQKLGVQNLTLLGNNMVVINQINGIYKVKSDKIINMHKLAKQLSLLFKSCQFHYAKQQFKKVSKSICK